MLFLEVILEWSCLGTSRSKSRFLGPDHLGGEEGGSGTCRGRLFRRQLHLSVRSVFFFWGDAYSCSTFLFATVSLRARHVASRTPCEHVKLSDLSTSRPPGFLPTRQEFDPRISQLCYGFAGVFPPREPRVFKDDDFVPQAARWAETVSGRHSRYTVPELSACVFRTLLQRTVRLLVYRWGPKALAHWPSRQV